MEQASGGNRRSRRASSAACEGTRKRWRVGESRATL